MKARKRLFAGFLALAMLLCMNLTVFAEGEPTPVTPGSQNLVKTYEVREGERAIAPAEKIEFEVEKVSVEDSSISQTKDMPTVTVTDVNYNGENNSAQITVSFEQFSKVGVYTYRITEKSGKNAGVTYDKTPVYLTVIVTRNESNNTLEAECLFKKGEAGEKGDVSDGGVFVNKYVTGDLSITKTVTGKFGETTNTYFNFTVKLKGEEGLSYASSYAITGGSSAAGNPGTISFNNETKIGTVNLKLKHGDTVTIEDLPDGMTYCVTEGDYSGDGYTTTINDEEGRTTGEIKADFEDNLSVEGVKASVTCVNDKDGSTVDTGVYLDNLPYIIVFAGVLAAVAVLVIRRRRVDD